VKFGVVFPQTEIGSDPAAIRDYVQAAEGLGYDYLLAYEHMLGADPANYQDGRQFAYTYQDSFHEPMVLFGYLAALTEQIELVAGVLILPQRNTALVAKQTAEVDVLSRGRLRLGIGVGWNQAEMEGIGYDFRTRGRRVDEQIEVLLQLWTKPLVTFEGEYHAIQALGINPLPVQRPIPLWFGGAAEPMLRRMARFGNGWIPTGLNPGNARPIVERIHTCLGEFGRSAASFGIDARLNLARQPQTVWRDYVEDWKALGATHICVNTMGARLETAQDHIRAIEEFKASFAE
jgi:probable F420-dependent oxidoreductase